MHCLEVAKTAWNATVVSNSASPELISTTRRYLELAQDSLSVFRKEGDGDGPLSEAAFLDALLHTQT